MAPSTPIDYAGLAAALLERAETLVPQWLPGGKRNGHEYVCGDLSGGEGRSCSVNLVNGRWADFSGSTEDAGGDLISLYAAIRGLNQGQAARELMQDLGWQREPVQRSGRPASTNRRGDKAPPDGDGRPEPPAEGEAAPAGKRKSMWRPIVPVPEHAPPCDFWHWNYKPADLVCSWEYVFEGTRYGHVARFRTSTGGKEVLPYTWCVDESDGRGTCRWHSKQWEAPRPLFVPAGVLSGTPADKPVVLVEGEKCAVAGHELLGGEFDFVSWPGGGKAWEKAAWAWLMGRVVIMWPDCDAKRSPLTKPEREGNVDPESKPLLPEHKQPGLRAMTKIGAHLVAECACTVSICQIPKPGDVADGWDIADAIAGGWGAEDVRAFLRGAVAFDPPAAEETGQGDGGGSTPGPAAAKADEPRRRSWRQLLLVTQDGVTKACRENVVLAVDGLVDRDGDRVEGIREAAGVIGYNEFTNDVMKLRDAPWSSPAGKWEEVDELLMGDWLAHRHYMPTMPRAALEEGVRMVAWRHRFHPVRRYLEGLGWDGHPRLKTWLRRAVLEEDEWDDAAPLQRYLARVGTWFLQGMVARVMRPGVKFDYMLILEGPQGWRKSTLLATLAGDYFADTGLVLGEKDSYQQLQGRWLYEFPELDAFSKADVRKIKAFIASVEDYFRASFDKRARAYPRQLVFGGSTNEERYLTDSTGNRRMWPVQVTRLIDIEWLAENRDQLFAEAMVRFQRGDRMYPTPKEEKALFEPQQQARMVPNLYEAALLRWLATPDGQLKTELGLLDALNALGIQLEKLGPGDYHLKQMAAALRGVGWTAAKGSHGTRATVYRRPTDPQGGAGGSQAQHGPTQGHQQRDPNDIPF